MNPSEMVAGPALDAEVARVIFKLTEGVDFGTWPDHDWKRDEDGEIDMSALDTDDGEYNARCLRCWHIEWLGWRDNPKIHSGACTVEPDAYSTNIAAAWTIIERLKDLDFDRYIFFMVLRPIGVDWPEALLYVTPEQICRAALFALEPLHA